MVSRTLRFFSVALIAALALSAVVASMATADDLTAETEKVTLTGTNHAGEDEFKVAGGVVKCKDAHYDGTAITPTTTVTLTPTYSGCTFVGLASTIDMNGCDYLLHIEGPGSTSTTATVDIVCPANKEITVTAPAVGTAKCIVHVPPQVGLKWIHLTNTGVGTTREITGDIHLTLKYSQTAGTAEAGNCATVDNKEDGTYVGKATLTGLQDPGTNHVGIFLT